MSSNYEVSAQQYKRYMTQQNNHSPTRKTAVKFLMTSPENPFGQVETENDDEGFQLSTYDQGRRSTLGAHHNAASPESGVKQVTMYSQLQEEIKKDARRRSDLALGGESQFQFLIGCRSDSPTVSALVSSSYFTDQSLITVRSFLIEFSLCHFHW